VAAEKAEYGVALVCRCVAVSAAGFYAWHRRRPSDRDEADRRLGVEIAAAHTDSRRTYGSPRVHLELQSQGTLTLPRFRRHQGYAAAWHRACCSSNATGLR
jgi:putative transposase